MPSIHKTDIAPNVCILPFFVLTFTCLLAIWNLEGKNSLPVPSHEHMQSDNIKCRKSTLVNATGCMVPLEEHSGKIKKCTNYSSVLLSP